MDVYDFKMTYTMLDGSKAVREGQIYASSKKDAHDKLASEAETVNEKGETVTADDLSITITKQSNKKAKG